MRDKTPQEAAKVKAGAQQQRRTEALRLNLGRRKEQARAREDVPIPARKTLIRRDEP